MSCPVTNLHAAKAANSGLVSCVWTGGSAGGARGAAGRGGGLTLGGRRLASGAVTDVICSLPCRFRTDGGSTLCVVRVRCPVLVGREPEMVLLADAVARARSGDGAAIFVVGAAGIGKSALARAAVALARDRGVLALVGRAVPRPSPTLIGAFQPGLLTGVGGGVSAQFLDVSVPAGSGSSRAAVAGGR